MTTQTEKFWQQVKVQYAAVRLIAKSITALKLLVTIAIFFAAPTYLYYKPKDYTPFVEILLNIFLFLMAYSFGNSIEAQRAVKSANDRWLPQAESVIFRLMTLHANVLRFSRTTKSSCSTTCCDLPELKNPDMRAVRVKIKGDCEAASQRLDDIAHQLEDAIEDWRRFVSANCHGEECNRIFLALEQRANKLQQESVEMAAMGNSVEKIANQPP